MMKRLRSALQLLLHIVDRLVGTLTVPEGVIQSMTDT
jgi:hypothetical protein